eukprot:gb/GECG01001717.1/.p1 GENE.gb/GECG01001717.1/~~gb/GECG01001717.1/.p1  ORF type:complete len:570 (+),score=61.79 gb/GECG01001717.1/:1-1710(+)
MSSNLYIISIDQGTTSTRSIIFDRRGQPIESAQMEHEQFTNEKGWVEHDPLEILENTKTVVRRAYQNLAEKNEETPRIASIGITNQRETTVIWEKDTGKPVYNAIVWQDPRTEGICRKFSGNKGPNRFRDKTGLPLYPYFSATKICWIFDNVSGVKSRAKNGELLFGTIDTWLIWNLTGGPEGGIHVTDVTNGARTFLMNINTLQWDDSLCDTFDIPRKMLPTIKTSSEIYGLCSAAIFPELKNVPFAGILGDQNAALFGQACFTEGSTKQTYGTGGFLLQNTGHKKVESKNNLLTIVAYQIKGHQPVYGLEGSIAVAGSVVQWLRDKLHLIGSASEVEALARTEEDNGGVYLVPAFTGLFAPYWRSDARGIIVGLTRNANSGHIARAAIESAAFQTQELLACIEADSGVHSRSIRVDGGMAANNLLMQFQADISEKRVIRPKFLETTCLGAAYVAGLAVGYWEGLRELEEHWSIDREFEPKQKQTEVIRQKNNWRRAVKRTFGWATQDVYSPPDELEETSKNTALGRVIHGRCQLYCAAGLSLLCGFGLGYLLKDRCGAVPSWRKYPS